MASSVSVHVKLTINPSHAEAFLTALKPTVEAVIAEPLNTFFEVYKLDKEPGVFKLVENWDATPEYMVNVRLYLFLSLSDCKERCGGEN
jgi:quinol monooxygenase YgiN